MKPFCRYISAILSLAISFSCIRIEEEYGSADAQSIKVHAANQDSKTYWDGETIRWSQGDCIKLAYTYNGEWNESLFTSNSLTADSERGEFSISTSISETAENLSFYAIYPAACTQSTSDQANLTISIPASQTPPANTFDRTADVMLGKSLESYSNVPTESIPIIWNRIVSHADITISSLGLTESEKLIEIRLTANPEAKMTGQFSLNMETGEAVSTESGSSANTLTLKADNAIINENEGLNIWGTSMPCNISSLEVEILTNKAIYSRSISSCDVRLKANRRNLLSIDMSGATKTERDAASLIRSEHPRMFITSDDIPTLKTNSTGYGRVVYNNMKSRINTLMANGITFQDPLAESGEYNTNHEIGFRACEAALIWLISEDTTYLEYTKTILSELTEYYQLRVDNNLNIAWYIYSQICALCAYDWIYNDLSATERKEFGQALYKAMYEIAWHGTGIRDSRYRENISGYTSGCYGVDFLPYYVGLAFYGDGINDAKCAEMFKTGYEMQMQMAQYRSQMAGEKGGGATTCATYSMGSYPVADFNFIYTYRSATGIDLSEDLSYIRKYLDYINWITLPGAKEYGLGDTSHYQCTLPLEINYHLAEIVNLYGQQYPDVTTTASRLLSIFTSKQDIDQMPFMRMLHTYRTKANSSATVANESKSMYFENMGQLYMRSGTGSDDSYAVFSTGGVPTNHKHFDNNHFILYRNGYRTLDTGTRPEPGQHLSHYYSRTVAHNCVTIRMPGETMPTYWGTAAAEEEVLPVPNDGGQCSQTGSVLKEHVETSDYVYIASDASKCYNSKKASLVMREFVWCMPDIYIVFDRMTSTDASYTKTWLYHTAAEPVIDGKEFMETSQGGASICRTLYPADAVIEKIGGDGKQFWSDGRNWPLPAASTLTTWPYVGQWRIEVKPGTASKTDYMMHMIQVGSDNLTTLPQTTIVENSASIGVQFTYDSKQYVITFDKTDSRNYGCNITIN